MATEKAGAKTSEFYLTLLVMAIIVLNKVLNLGLEGSDLMALIIGDGAYAISRGISKKQ